MKTPHGKMRPEYHRNPETNRDPMSKGELAANRARRVRLLRTTASECN